MRTGDPACSGSLGRDLDSSEGGLGRIGMFQEILQQKKSEILRRWIDLILETYPEDTRKFLKSQRNRFSNPVGATISEGLEGLLDHLLEGGEPETASTFLDRIIRIRAVQDFSPSMAIAFVPQLKAIVRELISSQRNQGEFGLEEILDFEARVDQLSLMAFDTFMACREKLYQIRANELRNRTARLLKKTNLFHELQDESW